MTVKAVPVTEELHAYLVAHSTAPDAVLRGVARRTAQLGAVARMQVAPEEGVLLQMLVGALGARVAVEVGTFTGYSSVAIARGLAEGGRLICCDVSEEWTALAREAWVAAGVEGRVELRLGPAARTLAAMPREEFVDFAFVDADKAGYAGYYEELVVRLRRGGIIAFDNVFQGGDVVDSRRAGAVGAGRGDVAAMHAFNGALVADGRVDVVMLAVADGLTLARKR